jgi:hypothetical protein
MAIFAISSYFKKGGGESEEFGLHKIVSVYLGVFINNTISSSSTAEDDQVSAANC